MAAPPTPGDDTSATAHALPFLSPHSSYDSPNGVHPVRHPAHTPSSTPGSHYRPASFKTIRKVTVLALVIFFCQAALVVAFVAYIWSNKVVQAGSTIWVTIPNNTILLISTIISRIPPIVVPLVMALAAYGFATDWLVSSTVPLPDVPGAPTPEQYSIALRVIGAADLGALVAGLKYLIRFKRGGKKAIAPLPPHPFWLTKSIVFLSLLTFFAYLVGGIDLWLHQSVLSVHLTTFTTSRNPTTQFSRVVNQTLCTLINSSDIFGPTPCASISQGAHNAFIIQPEEGFATATNTSSLNEVLLLPNTSIALLLPAANLRSNYTYQATTFATYTTCAPVSLECNLYPLSGASTPYGCLQYPAFAGDMNVVPLGASIRTTFNESGTRAVGLGAGDIGARGQPLQFGVAALLESVGNSTDPQIVQTVHGPYALLLWCEMSILNVTYLHQPRHAQQIQILKYTLTDLNDTFTVSGPIYKGFGTNLIDPFTTSSALSKDAKTFGFAYAQQISRLALSLVAGMMTPSKTLVDHPSNPGVRGSQIPLASLVVFLFVFLLFSFCVLAAVGFSGGTAGPVLRDGMIPPRDVQAVTLAQARLTGSGPLIYEMFCADKLGRSGFSDSVELFGGDASAAQDRIRIGVVDRLSVPGASESHFGVSTEVTRGLDTVGGTVVL